MISFKVDHRTTNPRLHDLYVGYAMEELRVVNDAIADLQGMSRVTASILAGALTEQRNQFLLEDAAWAEANLRLTTFQPPPESASDDTNLGVLGVAEELMAAADAPVEPSQNAQKA